MRRLAVLAVAAALALGCPGLRPRHEPADSPRTLTVLYTSDTHGYIWPTATHGGAARRSTLIQRVRREAETAGALVLLLDAGDVRTGTYCSDLRRSQPDFEAMAAMGYDAMALGNHELDVPLEVTLEQRASLPFPLLSANALDPDTGLPVFTPFVVLERDGLRIALLGLVTEEAATTSTLGASSELRFEDPIAVARRSVPELRQRADVVIVLSHLGVDVDRRLVDEVSGIDLVVGGHSHTEMDRPEVRAGVPIAHAGSSGRLLGRVDLEVGRSGTRLVRGEVLPVDVGLPEDPEVAAILERSACPEEHEVLAEAEEPVTRAPLEGPGASSALSNLVGDAWIAAAEADVAIMNRGGLRADLAPGPITRGAVHSVLPFANTLVVLDATGAELEAIARSLVPRGSSGSGILMPSGMEWVIGPGDAARVTVNGAPVDPERRFELVVSSFVAGGGDRHPSLSELPRARHLDVTTSAALEAHVRRLGRVRPDRTVRSRWVVAEQGEALAPPATEAGTPLALPGSGVEAGALR